MKNYDKKCFSKKLFIIHRSKNCIRFMCTTFCIITKNEWCCCHIKALLGTNNIIGMHLNKIGSSSPTSVAPVVRCAFIINNEIKCGKTILFLSISNHLNELICCKHNSHLYLQQHHPHVLKVLPHQLSQEKQDQTYQFQQYHHYFYNAFQPVY